MDPLGRNAVDLHSDDATNQHLLFQVEREVYGVPVLQVQEIIGYRDATPIPNSPRYLRGVLNLRGLVIPIVDLRRQFGFPDATYGPFNVIVIVQACGKTIGIAVDSVNDVTSINKADIQPKPDFASKINTEFISGVVSRDNLIAVMLDLERVFTDQDIGILDGATDAAAGNN